MQAGRITFADVFHGIGGFRLGLQQASDRFECVWSCENNKYAKGVYNHGFNETNHPEDIFTVQTGNIPDIELLCGGFPCQSYSRLGNMQGLDDPRGILFFQLARILRDKRPSYYLFENVKNILYHDKGNTFRKIASVLWELGYTVEWQILDTRDFGIPQRRERVFITGSLRSKSRPKVYPVIGGPRVYCPPDWASKKCERWFWGKSYFSTFPRHYHKGVTCAGETYILMRTEDGLLRRLTPLEAERLQGFPDGWTSMMLIDGKTSQVSDTQRYSLIGNAVSVPVIKAIGERLYAQS